MSCFGLCSLSSAVYGLRNPHRSICTTSSLGVLQKRLQLIILPGGCLLSWFFFLHSRGGFWLRLSHLWPAAPQISRLSSLARASLWNHRSLELTNSWWGITLSVWHQHFESRCWIWRSRHCGWGPLLAQTAAKGSSFVALVYLSQDRILSNLWTMDCLSAANTEKHLAAQEHRNQYFMR